MSGQRAPAGNVQRAEDDAPLWVVSAEIDPLVTLHAQDEAGQSVYLSGSLGVFLPFARQVIALHEAMSQPAQYGHDQYAQAG